MREKVKIEMKTEVKQEEDIIQIKKKLINKSFIFKNCTFILE